ncbi:BolA like protein [Vairimorpha necatrix]|uniref:BolA like protein n=1 Tax=Vairimorpha necatrix TaxID=6039 RepID=A0AAX4J8L6_9MICR
MAHKLEDEMKQSLTVALEPVFISFVNLSYLHVGHDTIKDNTSEETHFKVKIKSKKFNGLSQVMRQKTVYKIINYAFDKGLHALELDCESDNE